MHFQIYIPATVAADHPGVHPLESVGLADLVGDSRQLGVDTGPDDARGVCFGWSRSGFPQLGYRPTVQAWRPAVPCGDLPARRYWVGLWKDSPPTPDDLQRPYAVRGKWLGLPDGHEWLLPQAKELPATAVLSDDGTWRFEVQRKYHDFHLKSLKWFEHFGRGERSFTFDKAIAFLMAALRINYRVVPEVIDALGLLTSDNIGEALLAIVAGFAGDDVGGDA